MSNKVDRNKVLVVAYIESRTDKSFEEYHGGDEVIERDALNSCCDKLGIPDYVSRIKDIPLDILYNMIASRILTGLSRLGGSDSIL